MRTRVFLPVLVLAVAFAVTLLSFLSFPVTAQQESFSSGDPSFGNQWALQNTGQFTGSVAGVDLGIASAWQSLPHPQSRPVIVAVIDTGVDYLHPDLANRIWKNSHEIPNNGLDDDRNGYADDVIGWNFAGNSNDPRDDHSHGTLLAGAIAAQTGNHLGIAGVAGTADVQIMAIKCFDANASGTTTRTVAAIDYAIHNGAQIINLSWGDTIFTSELLAAIRRAVSAGCLVITAAGNSASNNDSLPVYPASFGSGSYALSSVLSVAAFDEADRLTPQSNYGATSVDLVAPGSFIFTTMRDGNYGYVGGTSIATAMASGVAALVLAKNPTLTAAQVKEILNGSVRRVASLQGKTITGGAIHAARALAATPSLPSPNSVVTVSAADFVSTTTSSGAIVAAFGAKLATGTDFVRSLPLPTSLAGSVVRINGIAAPLFAVTPGQINFLVPENLSPGAASITITAADGTVSTGTLNIASHQPGIFTANQSGTGTPAAVWTPDGIRYFAAARSDGSPLPIEAESYLVLACTGLRNAPNSDGNSSNGVAENVQLFIAGLKADVLYAGAQGGFAGLDQVNVRIPNALRGYGPAELVMTVAGKTANKVTISIR